MIRNPIKHHQPGATAHPIPDRTKNMDARRNAARRPKRSANHPETNAPTAVAQIALETVRPSPQSSKANRSVRDLVVPDITDKSKPNKNPPRDAATTMRRRMRFTNEAYCFASDDAASLSLRLPILKSTQPAANITPPQNKNVSRPAGRFGIAIRSRMKPPYTRHSAPSSL